MLTEIQFSVTYPGRHNWPLDGYDSVIATAQFGVLSMIELRSWALQLSETMAVNLGTHLHHCDFILTSSPHTVREWAIMPEHRHCRECQDGMNAALDRLEEHPETVLAIGQLYWSPEPPSSSG